MCTCSFGMAPSTLMVTPEKKTVSSMPVATIMDHVPMKNVMPFGMCQSMANPAVAAATAAAFGVLTPMPCIPGDPGAVVTGVTDSSRRKYAGVEPEFEDHLRLWRRDPDHEPGNDKHTDTLKLRK